MYLLPTNYTIASRLNPHQSTIKSPTYYYYYHHHHHHLLYAGYLYLHSLTQTVSLRNTVLQLFCCYYSRYIYRQFQCSIYCTFTSVLSDYYYYYYHHHYHLLYAGYLYLHSLTQTVSLHNTVLQQFCCYYSRCLYR